MITVFAPTLFMPQPVSGAVTFLVTENGSDNYVAEDGSTFYIADGNPIPPSTTTLDPSNLGSNSSLSGGNLILTCNSDDSNGDWTRSTNGHTSGKYYYEATLTFVEPAEFTAAVGVIPSTLPLNGQNPGSVNSASIFIPGDGNVYVDGTPTNVSISITSGDVMQVAVDVGNSLIWIASSGGAWNGSLAGDPASGTGGISISSVTGAGTVYAAIAMLSSGEVITVNFGATSYSFTPPTGFSNW